MSKGIVAQWCPGHGSDRGFEAHSACLASKKLGGETIGVLAPFGAQLGKTSENAVSGLFQTPSPVYLHPKKSEKEKSRKMLGLLLFLEVDKRL